jgi:hypothetical protein
MTLNPTDIRSILQEAEETVNGPRQVDYGDPVESFKKAAVIASVLTGKNLTARDLVDVLISLKQVRELNGTKRDHYVDHAGYVEIKYRIVRDEVLNNNPQVVVINAKPYTWKKENITYWDIVALSESRNSAHLTVTYQYPAECYYARRNGIINSEEALRVINGMIINITDTSRA